MTGACQFAVCHRPDTKKPLVSNLRDEGLHGGAACRNRTDDLFITSEMLYRLS